MLSRPEELDWNSESFTVKNTGTVDIEDNVRADRRVRCRRNSHLQGCGLGLLVSIPQGETVRMGNYTMPYSYGYTGTIHLPGPIQTWRFVFEA